MLKTRPAVSVNAIYAMRRSGATLQQIADRTDRSKERIRQILLSNYGSTKHKLMSTEKLRSLFGFSRHHILDLHNNGIITPMREWDANNGHYLLWSASAIEEINNYNSTFMVCKMCGVPIPPERRVFCSGKCYAESHKYKNMSQEEKRRHLDSIRRYRVKRRHLSDRPIRDDVKHEPSPV